MMPLYSCECGEQYRSEIDALRSRVAELEAAQTVAVPDDHTKEPPYDLAVWVLSRLVDGLKEHFGDNFPDCDGDDVESDVLGGIIAFVEELSAPATPAKANAGPHPDCPHCQGSGAYYGTSPVCCGRPRCDGECCGNPEPEVVQCACETAQPAKVEDDVARDAARYRFLRMLDWFTGPLCVVRDPHIVFKRGSNLGCDCPSRDRLDAAIDAAMLSAAQAKEGKP